MREASLTTDRATKLLLALIAIGLWANILIPIVRSHTALADTNDDVYLSQIAQSTQALANGVCVNRKLCGY